MAEEQSTERAPPVPTFLGVQMKWVSLVMLVAQTVSVVFAMRLSRTQRTEGPRYLNTTAVFFSEFLKLLCSGLFFWREKGSARTAAEEVLHHFAASPSELLKVSVPSLLYTVQNNLLFISLSNLNGAVYQVSYQLKILTTAVLSVALLGKVLGPTKWAALLMLTAGVALIQLPQGSAAASASAAEGSAVVGLSAVLAACVTSGLAGVYLELILKQTDASIWLRNIQLAIFGSALALMGAFAQDVDRIQDAGFLQGYNFLVWCVILLQAVGGLVVAAVLKYADNLLKCFGSALSIVISCFLSATLLGEFTPGASFVFGTLLVLMATSLYSLGLPQPLQQFMELRLKQAEKLKESVVKGVAVSMQPSAEAGAAAESDAELVSEHTAGQNVSAHANKDLAGAE